MASKKRRRGPPQARRGDKYDLYVRAVQAPETDVGFVQRVHTSLVGRPARFLREDFCGTAALACAWVKAHGKNRALGVDIDPEPLAWGREHYVEALRPSQQDRIELVRGDVMHRRRERADVLVAFNFSYFLFKSRPQLLRYFRAARSHIAPRGLLLLDAYGGADSQRVQDDIREVDGFDYVWDQHVFDPISHHATNYIHFEFPDGSRLNRAFTYHWRLWTLPEIRELLDEAGFKDVAVYWEGTERRTNEPNGVFTRRERAPDDPAWICYIAARR